jgi:Zn-dependent protease
VSLAAEARRRRFHQIGPWILAGTAIGAGIIVEAVHRHVLNSEDVWYFVVLIPSIILHEVSHGAVANVCGDRTAKEAGRLTLNPLKHVDIFGTILLPILLIVTTGTAFGWAKPVPVSINRLRHPRNQAVLVGLAGPAVNIVLALIFGFILRFATNNGASLPFGGGGSPTGWPLGYELLFLAGYANVIVAAFNLIPVPPLDGSAVVERLLPQSVLPSYYRVRSFSMLLVFALVFLAPGLLDTIFDHALSIWVRVVFS